MKIAILGTRGIPNNYGGFEQFAEYLSVGLVSKGHEVTVYNQHNHKYQKTKFKGVDITHKFDPEFRLGTAGQFVYDLNCILDTRKKKFDIILQLGYTSSAIWNSFLPQNSCIVTNMDGLEWKRSKFNSAVQRFLKWSERKVVKRSDYLIADSKGIQQYLFDQYHKTSTYIAYGAATFNSYSESVLDTYSLKKYTYDLIIARIEPENNIQLILEAYEEANNGRELIVIGDYQRNSYGKSLYKIFGKQGKVRFLGAIYDLEHLNNIRCFSNLYFHGHSVGGTNPSLLEAMAAGALICAHDNIFNFSILGQDAYYFKEKKQLVKILQNQTLINRKAIVKRNKHKISKTFSWDIIIESYERLFNDILS